MFDENMCRFCLKSSTVTIKIFTANIPDIIEMLTSIKVKENDGFPSISCKSCICDLYAAYQTRKRIIESEWLLRCRMVSLSTQQEAVASHSKNNTKDTEEKTKSATPSSECEPKIEIDEIFIEQDEKENEHSQEKTKNAIELSECESKIEIDELLIKQEQNEDENEHSEEKMKTATQSSECEPKTEIDDEIFIEQDQNEDENELSQEIRKSVTPSSECELKIEIDELFIEQDGIEDENEHSQEKTRSQSSECEPKIEIDELFLKQDQNENEHSGEQEEDEEEEGDAIDDFIFDDLDDEDRICDLIQTKTNQEKSDSYVGNEQKSSNDNTEMTNKEKGVLQSGGISAHYMSVSTEDYEVLPPESDIIQKDISCNPSKYSCKICNISLHPGSTVLFHRNKHLKAKCKICDLIVRKDYIWKHVMSHKRGPQICHICGSQQKSSEGFRAHMFYHHKNKKFYKCEHCDAQFLSNSTRWSHKRRVHLGDRQYQCEQCGKAFFASIVLKKHRDLVHLGLRPYPCDFCSKRFCSTYALKTHRRQHTGELPYTCGVCTAGFKQAVSLRAHMKSKHNIIVKANKPGCTYTQQARRLMEIPSEN